MRALKVRHRGHVQIPRAFLESVIVPCIKEDAEACNRSCKESDPHDTNVASSDGSCSCWALQRIGAAENVLCSLADSSVDLALPVCKLGDFPVIPGWI